MDLVKRIKIDAAERGMMPAHVVEEVMTAHYATRKGKADRKIGEVTTNAAARVRSSRQPT